MGRAESGSFQRSIEWGRKLKPSKLIATASAILVCGLTTWAQTASSTVPAASEALRRGQFQTALNLTIEALAKTSRDFRLWTLRGIALSDLHRQKQALAAYNHALSLAPRYVPALEGAAEIEYQARGPRAIPLLQELLSEDPDNQTTHAMLAVLYYTQNNCAVALRHFDRSLSLIATQPLAYEQYGACLYRTSQYDRAAEIFGRLLAVRPENRQIRYDLALALWMAKRNKSALEALDPIVRSSTPDANVLSLASDIEEAQGNTQRAVNLLRQAILADPKNSDLYLQFAILTFSHDSYKVGIDILSAGLTQLPKAAELYLARGILYIQVSNYEKGLADLNTANRLDPTLALTRTAEGLLDSQKHDMGRAIEKFRQAIRANPQDAYSHYLLAQALMSRGRTKGAADDGAERTAAKQAIQLDPKLGAARDLLATIDLEDGNIKDAIAQSRAALRLDANDQAAIYHLILALRKTDDKSDIPRLVKKLGALKKESAGSGSKKRILRLEEQPSGKDPSATTRGK